MADPLPTLTKLEFSSKGYATIEEIQAIRAEVEAALAQARAETAARRPRGGNMRSRKHVKSLEIKLASLVVHCEELLSVDGREADKEAIRGLCADEEIGKFVASFPEALLPPKRRPNAR